jgi:hypothetical protein
VYSYFQQEARQAYSKCPTYFQERKKIQEPKEDIVVTLTFSKDPSPRRDTTTPKTVERSSYSQSDEMETEAISAYILVLCTQFNFTTPSQV